MSKDTDILREYLIKLGFQVDATGMRKLREGVAAAEKTIMALGGAAVATATAVVALADKMAHSLDDLYFASRRTGASAENIKALGFAASRLGSTSAAARESLENLARFLRNNPGAEGWLGQIGVQARGANGQLRDTANIFRDIGKNLARLEPYQANAVAEVLGLDERTMMAMRDGTFEKLVEAEKKKYRSMGVDMEKATEQANDFENAFAEIKDDVTIVATVIETKLLPLMKAAASFAHQLATEWVKAVNSFNGFNSWPRIVREWNGADDFMESSRIGIKGRTDIGSGVTLSKDAQARIAAGETGGGGRAPRGIRNNNPGNIEFGEFAKSMGATGSDGRFAIFDTPEAGLAALAGLMRRYGRKGIDTVQGIVSRFAPPNENNTGAYVAGVASRLGIAPNAHLNLTDPAVLANLLANITQIENGRNPYSSDLIRHAVSSTPTGAAAAGAGLNQTTNIYVQGADAHETAAKVAQAQDQQNQRLVRDLSVVIR